MKEKVEGKGCKKCSLLLPKLWSVALQQGFNQEGSLLLWRVTWRRKKESASILFSHILAVCSVHFSSKNLPSVCKGYEDEEVRQILYLVELSSLVMVTDVKKDSFWYMCPCSWGKQWALVWSTETGTLMVKLVVKCQGWIKIHQISTLLIIRELQIKTVRYHLMLVRMAIIKSL